MEMKYLSEQDSKNICLPIVHVNGIVGLDVNPTTNTTTQDIPLESPHLLNGSKIKLTYYDNIVYVSADIQLTSSGIAHLKQGNTISIECTGLNNTEDVVLDCIITNNDAICDKSTGYIYIKNSAINISAICKYLNYTSDEIGVEHIEDFNHIVGNGISTTKSFAPIRPIVPNGYITLTYPQRIQDIVIGPVASTKGITIETDHGTLEVIQNGTMYTLKVTNTTRDYTLKITGNIVSFVYPRSVSVMDIEIHDCANMKWFSVMMPSNDGTHMINNTSLSSIGIWGQHKMQDMSYFLSDCIDLVTIKNFDMVGVKKIDFIFKNCKRLSKLPYMSLTGVITAYGMCYNCIALSYIPDNLDWSTLIDTSEAFYQCRELVLIPKMNSKSLVTITQMYFGCSKLTKIIDMQSDSIRETTDAYIGCPEISSMKMTGLTVSISIQDTGIKNRTSAMALMDSFASASIDAPATLTLPQNIALYEFSNDFLKNIANKNWRISNI